MFWTHFFLVFSVVRSLSSGLFKVNDPQTREEFKVIVRRAKTTAHPERRLYKVIRGDYKCRRCETGEVVGTDTDKCCQTSKRLKAALRRSEYAKVAKTSDKEKCRANRCLKCGGERWLRNLRIVQRRSTS